MEMCLFAWFDADRVILPFSGFISDFMDIGSTNVMLAVMCAVMAWAAVVDMAMYVIIAVSILCIKKPYIIFIIK